MLNELGRALRAADSAAAAATLDDEVILWVAVHDEPFPGVGAARMILDVVLDGPLHDIEVVDHRVTAPAAAEGRDADVEILTFTAGVTGYRGRGDGLLLARTGVDGRIGELTVFLRPLAALSALADEMGRRMAGPRPDGTG